MEETHDPECVRGCVGKVTDKKLCVIAQKAMRQATGYFSGYICKRQPVGRFELRQAGRNLPLLQPKLLSQKNVAGQLAQVVNRMFCTFETRGKLRTAAEEHNLAANSVEEDKMNAEFICLFVQAKLSGYDLLNRLEHEEGNESANEYIYLRSKKIPHPDGAEEYRWYNFADVYGFRPPLEILFYLSPWEFTQWFHKQRLR